jgi:hypothetical protein
MAYVEQEQEICIINDIQNNHENNNNVENPGSAGIDVTRFGFKVEQSKIPEFFDENGKDTVSAMDYICHIYNLTRTNNLSDTAACNNFAKALWGQAREWLFSMADKEDFIPVQLTWTRFKPPFRQKFLLQSNYKIMGLSNLAVKTTREVINRITKTLVGKLHGVPKQSTRTTQ